MASNSILVAHRASLFVLKPLIDTFTVIRMLAFLKLLDFLPPGKVFVADAALVFFLGSVTDPVPSFVRYGLDLVWLESLANLAILLLELK